MVDAPETSCITINMDMPGIPVNTQLYGLTLEEINHSIEGGLYGELIQNRSFEDGNAPLNCRYDAARNMLITPNGWSVPFLRPDSIPGWRALSKNTSLHIDNYELINDKNKRSLFVYVSPTEALRRGGVLADGFKGIPLKKGEKYDLTFYIKSSSAQLKNIRVALADSTGTDLFSTPFRLQPGFEWKKYAHTFTAEQTTNSAALIFETDTPIGFWLDVVSLFPEKTWKNRSNGQRTEVMNAIEALHPAFIRFPGGTFAEGYTAGTYPVWHETVGSITTRRHFWNVWSYGSTNGMGYHEYLQLCEDLKAEPIYVINSGVTSQSRRPRYENIRTMDVLVQDALDAIAYANQPADSTWGALRAKMGHPEPFGLKYIEIGSENSGYEYERRFDLFKQAINKSYPDIMVISSSPIIGKRRSEWADGHYYANESFLISTANRLATEGYSRRPEPVFIGEFALSGGANPGTMRTAIAEAAFLIGAENGQDRVKRLAYAPLLGNSKFSFQRYPALLYNGSDLLRTPTYHMLNLFWNNRGDEVLKTTVQCFMKPQVQNGRPAIELFDNSYDIKDVEIDNKQITSEQISVRTGDWQVLDGRLIPVANRWNYLLLGDSLAYNYSFSALISRTKGSGIIQLRVRDNGRSEDEQDYIGLTIGHGEIELYRQSGAVRDTLCAPFEFPFQSHLWYNLKIECKNDLIRLIVDGRVLREITLHPLPSLLATTAYDKKANCLLLKVVNTTQHEERTKIDLEGGSLANTAEVIELVANENDTNSFENPDKIIPHTKNITFSIGVPHIYSFPPNSITLMKIPLD